MQKDKVVVLKDKKSAFTLAEVLITLGIIGVVAALTIPTLMQNIQNYQYKQAWKKEFSVITQAVQMLKNDNGGSIEEWTGRAIGNYLPDPFLTNLTSYMKVADSCINNWLKICDSQRTTIVDSIYKTASGGQFDQADMYYGNVKLADGTHIFFRTYNPSHVLAIVDVNGHEKGPNTLGKDAFGLVITSTQVLPLGLTGTGAEGTCITTSVAASNCGANGYNCGSDISGLGCSSDYLYN